MRGLLEAMRVLLEAVVVLLEALWVFAEAFVMSTKSKQKHKRSDIEAKDQNETKMCWCVPEPKVERFYLFQKFWDKTKTFWCVPTFCLQKQNVSIYSKNFGTKPKLFDVFQLFY